MADAPVYKATLTKTIFERVGSLPAAEREAVLNRMDPANVAAIEQAARTDWLPAGVEADLDNAILEELGKDRLTEYVHEYTVRAADFPVFTPIARGAVNLFGGGPKGMLKILPKTWGFVARHCGACKYAEEGDAVVISYEGLPEVMRTPAFVAASEGGLTGVLEFVRAKGVTVQTDSRSIGSGTVRYTVRWES